MTAYKWKTFTVPAKSREAGSDWDDNWERTFGQKTLPPLMPEQEASLEKGLEDCKAGRVSFSRDFSKCEECGAEGAEEHKLSCSFNEDPQPALPVETIDE